MSHERLLSTIQVGPVQLRNRVLMGAHFTLFGEPNRRFGEPGFYGQRMGEYVGDRAKGGVGAVIVGQTAIHPTTAYQMPNNSQAWSEESIPHFQSLTKKVHENGAKAFIQLTHNGSAMAGTSSRLPVWGASAVTAFFETSKPMEKSEIRELVRYWALCARNAVRGGFEGIEVQAAHGYLLHQFLSERYNKRTDEYGGSLENRMRFTVEVLEAVREALDTERIAVGLRLVGDEQYDGGVVPKEAAEIGAAFEKLGLVDFLNVSTGVSGPGMVQTNYAEHCASVYAAASVKAAVRSTPVFAVQRIITPDEAEGILERGDADAITLVRALVADPEWVNKVAAGKPETIRACTGSNQSCIGNMIQAWPVGCVQNPAVGREAELGLGTFPAASRKKKVVVVGGGPAGLEAAWVAAARGHDVTLLERADRLGGKIRMAQLLPGREELRHFADWRVDECVRRGVDIRLSTDATADDVVALHADAVIVATGGRPTLAGSSYFHPMPVPGSERDFVLDHEEALLRATGERADELGQKIVILDAVGHIEGLGIGEILATQGRTVLLVCPLASPIALDYETSTVVMPRTVRSGVQWIPNTVLAAIGDHSVTLYDHLADTAREETDVDTVVIRTHGVAADELYRALEGRVSELSRIGDAVAVRYCDRAIADGHLAGRAV